MPQPGYDNQKHQGDYNEEDFDAPFIHLAWEPVGSRDQRILPRSGPQARGGIAECRSIFATCVAGRPAEL
jgi:hypothetical protein